MRFANGLAVGSMLAAALLLAGCEASDVGAQDGLDYSTSLECFLGARNQTPLTDAEAFELCRGSRSLGPLQCYQAADTRTALFDDRSIRLCRCAEDDAPVQCFDQYKNVALAVLSEPVIIEECRPIVAQRLTDNCIPIVDLY